MPECAQVEQGMIYVRRKVLAMTWWLRRRRQTLRVPGRGLLGLGLMVVGMAAMAPAALGLNWSQAPKPLTLASFLGPGHGAHQRTGLAPGQAACPAEADP